MWDNYTEPETKAQSKQLKRAGYSSRKKIMLSLSTCKIMLVAFWDSLGIILAHFMPKGRTVTARYYSEVIMKTKLQEKLKKKYAPQSS